MSPDTQIATLSYELALQELDDIIEKLERGAVALEDAISCYERGAKLASHCAELLDRTEQKVSQLVIGGGGAIHERPLAEAPAVPAPASGGRPQRLPVDPDDVPF